MKQTCQDQYHLLGLLFLCLSFLWSTFGLTHYSTLWFHPYYETLWCHCVEIESTSCNPMLDPYNPLNLRPNLLTKRDKNICALKPGSPLPFTKLL